MKIIKIQDSTPKLLKVYYDLSNVCNYSCWYCFPESHSGTDPWPDPEIVKKNIVALINYYISTGIVNDIEIHFLGGEPTLWKHLGTVAEYIKKNSKCRINILTNGSRTLRWWEEYAHYFDHIGISVHHERADISHIVNVSEVLYKKNISFYTNVLMDHKNWDKCVSLVNQLVSTKTKWPVLVKPLHIDGVSYYTSDQLKYLEKQLKRKPTLVNFIRHYKIPRKKITVTTEEYSTFVTKNPNYFMMNMLNRFEGWECNLGINYLYIDRKGIVSGTCKQTLYGLQDYFNINDRNFEEKFTPTINPVICQQKICMCSGEASLTKSKISN
jgi:MoaA/NifB/PqqE/SkfB family radical SAM enzyme